MDDKRKKLIYGCAAAAFLLALAAGAIFAGGPILRFVTDPERFRSWVDSSGVYGRVAFVGMMVLQIVLAFIPGEPLEISAGYAFGALEGTLLCMAGAAIGGLAVFLFVRRVGIGAVKLFFPIEKINSLSFLRSATRLNLLIFVLFLIPGSPKDILSWCAGLTRVKPGAWLLITNAARIPSIVTSTVGGDALGMGNFAFAAAVFAVTIAISAAGLLLYNRLCRREKELSDGCTADN